MVVVKWGPMNSNTPDSDVGGMAADHVGEVLREAREACGKTQDDLASEAGLSRNGLHLIETKQSDPSLRNVEKIAQSAGSSLMIVIANADHKARKP